VDWNAWHEGYDEADSVLARRLDAVQVQIRAILDASPPGALRMVSACAGQGRDLLEVLAGHPRRHDVTARMVELDPSNAAIARATAAEAGLDQVEVVTGDASLSSCYAGMVPADLVLMCGVFGNITMGDIERTVATCGQLCKHGGSVIWTRHRREPDRVPQICDWYRTQEFSLSWLSDPDAGFGVGVHRFGGEPEPLHADERIFTFLGHGALNADGTAPVTNLPAQRLAAAAAESAGLHVAAPA
jgi:hypothetical protein